jgi:hypothetical protein
MKNIASFTPSGFGIIIGMAVGLATQNSGIGVTLAVVFSLISKTNLKK